MMVGLDLNIFYCEVLNFLEIFNGNKQPKCVCSQKCIVVSNFSSFFNIAYRSILYSFLIKLYSSQTDAERLYRRLTQLKNNDDTPRRQRRDGCLGLFGHKVDMLDHYEKTLGDIADNVRIEQRSLAGKVIYLSCLLIITFRT